MMGMEVIKLGSRIVGYNVKLELTSQERPKELRNSKVMGSWDDRRPRTSE